MNLAGANDLTGPGGIDLGAVTVAGLLRAVNAGEFTSAELTGCYLDRIRLLNPLLRAVIAVHADAMAAAEASDAWRRQGRPPRPLEGIPVLVKDNIAVTGLPTTAGSLALSTSAPPDAACVARLRDTGAVIIGKANLSEWANFRSQHSTSGWSSAGGQARNPHVLDRNPSGSSSGSGAAVAAHLAPLALGTETDGSVLCPASACGIVGVKPTMALVSGSGIVPISHRQDTAGPMTATVADAAVLLAAMTAADEPVLGPGALGGSRLGVWREGSRAADPRTGAVLDDAVAVLRSCGAWLADPVELPGTDEIEEPEFAALCHEFKHDLNAYLATLGGECPRTLAALIEYNERNAEVMMVGFGQDLFERAEATSGDLADEAYRTARDLADGLARRALRTPMEAYGLDAIVALTANPAWPIDPVLGDRDVFHTSAPAAVAGYPAITVPAGMVQGLPVGLTFMGTAWSEPRLLSLAYAFEQATGARRAPAYRETIELS